GEGLETALASYGLKPHPRLRFDPLFAGTGPDAWRRRLREDDGIAPIRVSRGETGVALFDAIADEPRRPGERRVLEQHRMCFDQPRPRPDPWRSPLARLRARRQARALAAAERRVLESVDGLVCVSAGLLEACRAHARVTAPTLVLPGGAAPGGPPRPDAERDLDVLYTGKLRRDKGVHVLIEAMARLPGRRLTVVGGWPAQIRELAEHAARHGVAERVCFEGWVPPVRVRAFVERARVGVCPLTRGESVNADRYTCPLKVLDWMAAGTPVVASDVAPVRALLEAGVTGELVAPNDPDALAEGIRRLLDDRARAAAFARAAQARAEEFLWSRRGERLHGFLASLRPEAA
ncbi:MAG: glycosyltransferase family 4 protein, partial [Myxococcales bacterium]|nr:glycosyltransferase family 4 protein [Myxococcales bacterium]